MKHIIGILDSSLNEVAKYTYDSWGKVLSITDENGEEITDSSHIGIENPFRYRGYWYDTETGLYYLQSRYYNPEWGRFLNADNMMNDTLLGKNLYAYCENNPINNIDPDGHIVISISTLLTVATVALGVMIVYTVIGIALDVASNISFDFAIGSSNKVKSEPTDIIATIAASSSSGKNSNNDGFDKKLNSKIKSAKKNSANSGGYNSFSNLKKAVGSPGKGNEWHHIVEQCQIKKSGLDVQMIQNKNNIISVSKGVHRKISGYYANTKLGFTEGLSVRNWLAGQSYETQYDFGLSILKMFGGL